MSADRALKIENYPRFAQHKVDSIIYCKKTSLVKSPKFTILCYHLRLLFLFKEQEKNEMQLWCGRRSRFKRRTWDFSACFGGYALIDPPKINLHLLKRKINYVQPCSAEM